jgi:hypothetical protein
MSKCYRPGVTANETFRQNVFRLLAEKQLRPKDMQQAVGKKGTGWASMLRSGSRDTPVKTAERIAAFLGEPLWSLYMDDATRQKARDLIRHGASGGSASAPGGTADAATPSDPAVVEQLQQAIAILTRAVTALSGEAPPARQAPPAHHPRHRKAG